MKTSIEFEHIKGNDVPEHEEEFCVEEITVHMEYEPGDDRYGADADGNRGVRVSGYLYPSEEPPAACSQCGHVYDAEERREIEKLMEQAVNDYDPDPDPREPEYEED